MSVGNEELGAVDGAGERRVDVAGDDHQIWLLRRADTFESHHHLRGLFGVGTGTDPQVDVGQRHAQITEEDVRHRDVVVLSGVNELLLGESSPRDGFHHRRDLHEVGASSDDVHDLHRASGSAWATRPRTSR